MPVSVANAFLPDKERRLTASLSVAPPATGKVGRMFGGWSYPNGPQFHGLFGIGLGFGHSIRAWSQTLKRTRSNGVPQIFGDDCRLSIEQQDETGRKKIQWPISSEPGCRGGKTAFRNAKLAAEFRSPYLEI